MVLPCKEERDRDLYVAYNRVIASQGKRKGKNTRSDLIRQTICSEAPRFYVTYEEARRNVKRVMTGQQPRCASPIRIAMYNDLSNMVAGYLRRHPSLNFNEALGAVLGEKRAPRFYITERSALLILYEKQRKRGGKA